jgi:hypothetical protein
MKEWGRVKGVWAREVGAGGVAFGCWCAVVVFPSRVSLGRECGAGRLGCRGMYSR